MKTYFTFGQIHAHSIDGKTFDKDCVVEIEADTHDKAREIMFNTFGKKWASQYNEMPDLKFYLRGIIKL